MRRIFRRLVRRYAPRPVVGLGLIVLAVVPASVWGMVPSASVGGVQVTAAGVIAAVTWYGTVVRRARSRR